MKHDRVLKLIDNPGITTAFLAIIVIIAVILASTVTGNFSWHGDAGIYLQHAKNIYEGKSYSHLVVVRSFPPGYPILLALWAEIFSWGMEQFKILSVVFLFIASIFSYLVARLELNRLICAIIALLITIDPVLVRHRQLIASDIPFLAFLMISLYCWRRIEEADTNRTYVTFGLFGSVASAIALTIRPAGLAIMIVAISAIILRKKTRANLSPALSTRLVLSVWVLFIFAAYFLITFHTSEVYTDSASFTISDMFRSNGYLAIFSYYYDKIYVDFIAYTDALLTKSLTSQLESTFIIFPIRILSLGAVLIGLTHRIVKRGFDSINLFFCLYLVLIFLTPWTSGTRYFIPVLSLSFFYIFKCLLIPVSGRLASSIPYIVAVFSVLTIGYFGINSAGNLYRGEKLLNPQTTDEALAWLIAHTSEDDYIVSFLPANTMYLTQRWTYGFNEYIQRSFIKEGADWMRSRDAKFLLLPLKESISPAHAKAVKPLLNNSSLMVVFRNDDYVIFAPKP